MTVNYDVTGSSPVGGATKRDTQKTRTIKDNNLKVRALRKMREKREVSTSLFCFFVMSIFDYLV